MADNFGDQDNAGGRRPAPTIEGIATEVSVEPAPGAAPSDEPKEQVAADAPKSLPGDGSGEKGDGSGIKKEGAGNPPPPPPPASVVELKSFLTHLAAGLLGGLVGVIALALLWHRLPGQAGGGAAPDLTRLEQRLGKLEAAPTEQPSKVAGQALTALDQRIAVIEARKPEAAPDLSGLDNRVTQLEQSLKALAETAEKGGSVADAAATSAQIGEAEQRLQGKIDTALGEGQAANRAALGSVEREVAELKSKLATLAEASAEPENPQVQGELASLGERIGKLEAALPGLAGAIDESTAQAKGAALALAFANFRSAVASGRPYAAELSTLRTLAPGADALDALAPHADTGIPTLPELTRTFQPAADAGLAAIVTRADGSFFDGVVASARSLVKIHRIDGAPTGDAPGQVLARADAHLKQGDLAAAVKEVELLQARPRMRAALAGWLDQAHARLGVSDALTRLEGTLPASMGDAARAPASATAPAPATTPALEQP